VRNSTQRWIHGRGERGDRSLDSCWLKNRDARPIKSRFYQYQNAPKLAFLSSEIENFSGRGNSPLPRPLWGKGTSPPHTQPPLPRCSRLRRSTRLAPSALDLKAYGASALGASIRPLATPFGSAPDSILIIWPKGGTRQLVRTRRTQLEPPMN